MPNRWPYRAATLVNRFERAVRAVVLMGGTHPPEYHDALERDLEIARRDLIQRIEPATPYQRQQSPR